MALDQF